MEDINEKDFEINIDNINVEEIMNKIRKKIKERGYIKDERISNFNFKPESEEDRSIQKDFEALYYLWNINLEKEIISKNKVFIFIKKIIRKLSRWYVKPIMEDQITFNSNIVRTINYLRSTFEIDKKKILENTKNISQILKKIETLENKLVNLENIFNDTKKEKDDLKENLLRYESYSQCGEDKIIEFILAYLGENKGLTYLDIGCNNYKNLNNTYGLYKKGIRGVLIDANPIFIEDVKRYRPEDTVLNCGIGPKKSKEMIFYIVNIDGLSSFDLGIIEEAKKQNISIEIENKVKVPVYTLDDIYINYFATVPTIVSLDVEGIELDILKSSDFEKYRPVIFIIESIEYSGSKLALTKREEILNFMREKGYVEYAFTGVNSIFIDKRRIRGI